MEINFYFYYLLPAIVALLLMLLMNVDKKDKNLAFISDDKYKSILIDLYTLLVGWFIIVALLRLHREYMLYLLGL